MVDRKRRVWGESILAENRDVPARGGLSHVAYMSARHVDSHDKGSIVLGGRVKGSSQLRRGLSSEACEMSGPLDQGAYNIQLRQRS